MALLDSIYTPKQPGHERVSGIVKHPREDSHRGVIVRIRNTSILVFCDGGSIRSIDRREAERLMQESPWPHAD